MPTPQLTIADYMKDRKLPLALVRDERYRSCPLHTHEFSELVIVLAGRGAHLTETAEYTISAGDAFVIKAENVHGYRVPRTLKVVNILYDEKELGLPMKDLPALPGYHALFVLEPVYRAEYGFEEKFHMRRGQLRRVERLVNELEREIESKEDGYVFMAIAIFMRIVGFLSRCYAEGVSPVSHPLLGVGQVMSHMETHFREPMILGELARIARMSESSLLRAFRRATGTSPIDYLIRLRVHRACERLEGGDQSVTEIAFEQGFRDSNYFARQFRRITGMTPSQYRLRSRSGPHPGMTR
jgi:AraC-like DNA-binding protein